LERRKFETHTHLNTISSSKCKKGTPANNTLRSLSNLISLNTEKSKSLRGMRFTWQADQVESCKYLKPALLLNAGLLQPISTLG
jgi:hypothetical protein